MNIELFVDNYNRLGYLIYRSGYFIFQQWMAEEYMPTYYRNRPPVLPAQKTNLMNFLTKKSLIPSQNKDIEINDFESNITYYNKFPEAIEMLKIGGGFSVKNLNDLKKIFEYIIKDNKWETLGKINKVYIEKNKGATMTIIKKIREITKA